MENEVNEQELFIPKTKHKGLKILLAIVLIAGLCVGGYFLYQHKFNNPKTIVSSLLEDARKELKENVVDEISSDVYKVDGHVKIDTNITDELVKGISVLKDIELQFSGEVDSKNSIANMTINTKYKSGKLLDLKLYLEKEVVYLLLDGIYDKYLKTDAKDADILPESNSKLNIDSKDAQALIDAIVESMQKEINKFDFKKEDATISIDGKSVDVLNNYVVLKDSQVNDFTKGLISNLADNKNFAEVFKKLTGEDAKTALEEAVKEMSSDSFKGTYKICFYTDKGLFEKKLVSVRQSISQDGTTVSFDVDKISDDEIKVSVSQTGVVFSIKVKKNNSAANFTLNVNAMGYYLNAEINTNYEKIKEVTKPDVSNSKNFEDLTKEEQAEIEKKILDNPNIIKLMEAIDSLQGIKGA